MANFRISQIFGGYTLHLPAPLGCPAARESLKRTVCVVGTLAVLLFIAQIVATNAAASPDTSAIEKIVNEEVSDWNAGDATAYSRHFAAEGTFTNIYGMVFEGHEAFQKRHAETFATFFKGSTRREKIRRIRFVTRAVAIVEVDTEVTGFGNLPAGVSIPPDGVLRTRLLQVFVKRAGEWWIETYHNVDVKAQPARGQ